jgi:hypothetical protein
MISTNYYELLLRKYLGKNHPLNRKHRGIPISQYAQSIPEIKSIQNFIDLFSSTKPTATLDRTTEENG